jgi:hypothetical protein
MEKKSVAKKVADMSTPNKVLMGAGLTALAAATAGAVFLYGTEAGKKKRKQITSWSLKMKADVLDKMENMKDWSEDAYYALVEAVGDKYKNVKNIDPAEVALLVTDLKRHWKTIHRQVQNSGKKKPAKRTAKKPAKSKAAKTA